MHEWILDQVKIIEITQGMNCYQAVIRTQRGTTRITARTLIFATSAADARALLVAQYGAGSVQSISRVAERDLRETAAVPVQPKIFPKAYKQRLVRNALVNRIKQNALHVNPTIDDLKAAQDQFDTEQKRADLEYAEEMKWAAIRQKRQQRPGV